jgi:hypothetical protein
MSVPNTSISAQILSNITPVTVEYTQKNNFF